MNLLMAFIVAVVFVVALIKKVDIFDAFCDGAKENLKTAASLCPTLILLVTVIKMFTESGASDVLSEFLKPVTSFLGFPEECTSLMLVRPISGSGSLAVLDEILSSSPADSFAARVACVMMGATETTLYTIAVYFAAVKAKPQIGVFISSFSADIAGFIIAPLTVRLFLG
ncbi:MAG: spore maturation protein [Ruminococcus sp.]|nr:spore maturation protein [Ruminococcus sp.]